MPADRDLDAIPDAMLDEALASYASAEPDPSLRARIMARMAEAAPHPWRLWTLSCAAACVAAVGMVLLLSHPVAHMPPPEASSARMAAPPVSAYAHTIQPRHVLQHMHAAASASRAHRHFQVTRSHRPGFTFADDTLSEQERTLLRFVVEHPKEAREVLTPPVSRPIEVAPLVIPPIELAALPGSGHNDPNHPEN